MRWSEGDVNHRISLHRDCMLTVSADACHPSWAVWYTGVTLHVLAASSRAEVVRSTVCDVRRSWARRPVCDHCDDDVTISIHVSGAWCVQKNIEDARLTRTCSGSGRGCPRCCLAWAQHPRMALDSGCQEHTGPYVILLILVSYLTTPANKLVSK